MERYNMKKINHHKKGMTLVEVSIAMAVTVVLSAGLLAMGISSHRAGEHLRIETEARAYAMEAVEEIIAAGKASLAMPQFSYAKPATMLLPRTARLNRTVSVIWHDKTGAVVAAMDDLGYAEVHVQVSYLSPSRKRSITDTFSTIVD